jgi:hypothetical protein
VRRLLTLLSAFSLLLCSAAGVMWWRSWWHPAAEEDRLSWLTSGGDRMTIRSDAGRVTLFEPPAGNLDAVAQLPQVPSTRPGSSEVWYMPRRIAFADPQFQVFGRAPSVALPTLRETLAALRSDQVEWFVKSTKPTAATGPSARTCRYLVQIESPAFLLSKHNIFEWRTDMSRQALTEIPPAFRSADAIPSLLPALEDPQRFVIAHLLLRHLYPQPMSMMGYDGAEVMNGTYQVDGLNVRVSEGKLLQVYEPVWSVREGVPSIDPAQLPRIRDQWHRRLDVTKASASWWSITTTLALMPLVWLTAFVRRALRRRQRQSRGLCRVCGYDLRASGGRCPECGNVAGVLQRVQI